MCMMAIMTKQRSSVRSATLLHQKNKQTRYVAASGGVLLVLPLSLCSVVEFISSQSEYGYACACGYESGYAALLRRRSGVGMSLGMQPGHTQWSGS